jgi:GNAT superfamily N-acetyltransferase
MPQVRPATGDDVALLTRIASEGFYDDPVMAWAMPDDGRRLGQLTTIFRGLAEDFVADRGRALLADAASACVWRDPSFDHHAAAEEEAAAAAAEADDDDAGPNPFSPEEQARLSILTTAMHEAHPAEAHWYLNVVATLPSHRSRGLGAAVLAPTIAEADADGVPCYLESTNPRNRTLYYRHGFEDMGDIHLDDGVAMRQMWRLPQQR